MRVLIADDHAIVRTGLRTLIQSEPGLVVTGQASDGLEALRACEQAQPDLVVADIAMPRMNGIELTAEVQRLPRPPRVIILSMHTDESYVLRSMAAGARAYLLKSSTDDDLLPALHAVSTGKTFFSSRIATLLVEDYLRQLQCRGISDSYDLLTGRERQVLQLLAEGRSNKEAAVLLGVETSTVETHRSNLMQKLDLHNTAEIVLYAVRKGIVT